MPAPLSFTSSTRHNPALGIRPGKRALTDPVRVLRHWISKRGAWAGPLFCRIQTGDTVTRLPITGDAISDLVKKAASRSELDPAEYGTHSLRAGAATASAEIGRSDQETMSLTGHASAKVMQGYVRKARLFSGRNPLAGVL
jgi:integrase